MHKLSQVIVATNCHMYLQYVSNTHIHKAGRLLRVVETTNIRDDTRIQRPPRRRMNYSHCARRPPASGAKHGLTTSYFMKYHFEQTRNKHYL